MKPNPLYESVLQFREENKEGDQGIDKKGADEVDAMKEGDDIDGYK